MCVCAKCYINKNKVLKKLDQYSAISLLIPQCKDEVLTLLHPTKDKKTKLHCTLGDATRALSRTGDIITNHTNEQTYHLTKDICRQ